jgi:hypothetical protein
MDSEQAIVSAQNKAAYLAATARLQTDPEAAADYQTRADSMAAYARTTYVWAFVILLAACQNGVEIPAGAVSLEGSPEYLEAVATWRAEGLPGDPSKCKAPYLVTVSTEEFESLIPAVGAPTSCSRLPMPFVWGYCTNAFTISQEWGTGTEHSSVTYLDAGMHMNAAAHADTLAHEFRHTLRTCTMGHGDAAHADPQVWAHDAYIQNARTGAPSTWGRE